LWSLRQDSTLDKEKIKGIYFFIIENLMLYSIQKIFF